MLIYCRPACMTECAHLVRPSEAKPVCECVFVKLYMHECASQSVCASATVSTPPGLSLHTKPAQRQMGNFLRGKEGGGESRSGSKKQQDVCLSLLF